jgi:hypothetical protein
MSHLLNIARGGLLIAAGALISLAAADARAQQFIPDIIISSTIPANGDLNPYGVALVPRGFPSGGKIAPGDILVSNFNNSGNTQGTGTTIIKLTPNGLVAPPPAAGTTAGNAITFFTSSDIGLTTALGVLRRGFVLVGSVPTNSQGKIVQGSLQVLDPNGKLVLRLTDPKFLDSPWDLTIDDDFDHATVFVSNVVSGTVTRLNLLVGPSKVTVNGNPTGIASGYQVMLNSTALILGPTGLAHDVLSDVLYVASTADNAIFAIPSVSTRSTPPGNGTGAVIFHDNHLRGPLALVLAPNGDLITSNGDAVNPNPMQPSEIVEFTKGGKFVSQFNVDTGQGGAFGIGVAPVGLGLGTFRLAVVDDNANDIIVIDQNLVPGN